MTLANTAAAALPDFGPQLTKLSQYVVCHAVSNLVFVHAMAVMAMYWVFNVRVCLFWVMDRNSAKVTDFFKLPVNDVVEISREVAARVG